MSNNNEIVRQLLLCDEVSNSTVRPLIEKIREINREDDRKSAKGGIAGYDRNQHPIVLTVNTPGGVITAGLALIDTIMTSKTPVHTEALGLVASMGIPLFVAGQKRTANEHTIFMFHEGSYGSFGTITQHERRLEVLKTHYRKPLNEFILSRTDILRTKIESVQENIEDWYFDADEAMKLGVATSINKITRISANDVREGNFVVE